MRVQAETGPAAKHELLMHTDDVRRRVVRDIRAILLAPQNGQVRP